MMSDLPVIREELKRIIEDTEQTVGITAATPVTMPLLEAMRGLDTIIRLQAGQGAK